MVSFQMALSDNRLLRFTDTPVGRVLTQIDYSNYREVSGVKMPFRWITT